MSWEIMIETQKSKSNWIGSYRIVSLLYWNSKCKGDLSHIWHSSVFNVFIIQTHIQPFTDKKTILYKWRNRRKKLLYYSMEHKYTHRDRDRHTHTCVYSNSHIDSLSYKPNHIYRGAHSTRDTHKNQRHISKMMMVLICVWLAGLLSFAASNHTNCYCIESYTHDTITQQLNRYEIYQCFYYTHGTKMQINLISYTQQISVEHFLWRTH